MESILESESKVGLEDLGEKRPAKKDRKVLKEAKRIRSAGRLVVNAKMAKMGLVLVAMGKGKGKPIAASTTLASATTSLAPLSLAPPRHYHARPAHHTHQKISNTAGAVDDIITTNPLFSPQPSTPHQTNQEK
ncbi:Hypothetical predicted protein [Olea europaea subsp. europaea]|uniref:Uncharacterized protein n=1 Tax=Olea europaea subsp. europaea TaxID=158383 RepID=A0A8S0QS61_OLEEU|nr:Hypothetical predicted protein [Olea europaea subsp. europaea]